jgi:DNA polymerase I-like protein with 3'-5' exonuclease and polymerase domains
VLDRVTNSYEHALQAAYYDIGNRGICVNTTRIAEAKAIVKAEVTRQLAIASNQWGTKVFVGAANAPDETVKGLNASGAININATQGKFALLTGLKTLGYEVVKITKKNSEGDYEQNYSTGELALQKMLSRNQFSYPGGDPAIRAILKIRELGKLYSSYLNARLLVQGSDSLFLSNYNVAGTLTGRRSSRRHTFGFGNNAQNFPKHSDVASMYRRCLTSRPGNIFLMVDQISAEDWPVSALSENHQALKELRDDTDVYGRHTRLAAIIFGIPLNAKTPGEWKDSMERYLGKKTRHASNYDMKAGRMSDALAQEGFSFSENDCNTLLKKVAAHDPSVQKIFHQYVKDTISKTHMLVTPFGRERQFLGARPNDSNSSVFKEAYAYIPQSTVGDNTGFAILAMETKYPVNERFVVQEGHDSIVQDVPSDIETVYRCLLRVGESFKRSITFHNGITVEIPIEAEVGYDFQTTVKIKEVTRAGVKAAIEKLKDKLASMEPKQVLITA